ncbi:hypothetical protein Pelo_5307 [Pelomyxa schiedti]|nr:hypothetical protein Pelo_5307 [Pelomyxa schiedti]
MLSLNMRSPNNGVFSPQQRRSFATIGHYGTWQYPLGIVFSHRFGACRRARLVRHYPGRLRRIMGYIFGIVALVASLVASLAFDLVISRATGIVWRLTALCCAKLALLSRTPSGLRRMMRAVCRWCISPSGNREFFVFVPRPLDRPTYGRTEEEKRSETLRPAVLLFHANNELNPLHSALWDNVEAWQTTSSLNGFVTVLCKSQHLLVDPLKLHNSDIQANWKPAEDIEYVDTVLDAIIDQYSVDPQRIYACGWSTGGMFVSELVLHSNRFAAVCNIMGGRKCHIWGHPAPEWNHCGPQWNQKLTNAAHKTPTLLISGTQDVNLRKCLKTKEDLEKCGWPVTYVELPDQSHSAVPERSADIWKYLSSFSAV